MLLKITSKIYQVFEKRPDSIFMTSLEGFRDNPLWILICPYPKVFSFRVNNIDFGQKR